MTINNSSNIAVLDSKITFDLCAGQIYMDLSPSQWIANGSDNVLGAKFKIVNPLGVTIKDYPSDYETTPEISGGIDATVSFAIPTQAGNYQYGKYSVYGQLTDSNGAIYEIVKTVSICAPNSLDKTKKYGNLSASLNGICKDGKVYVLISEVPAYKGFLAQSVTNDFILNYPTGSGLPSEETSQSSFSVQLFEGVYGISGTVCAEYNYGDNVFVDVQYKLKYSKPIVCSLDECCVYNGLQSLNNKLNSDCSEIERLDTQNRIEKATLILNTIDFGIRCGQDVSQYIQDLEDVIGISCSCNFDNGTPFVNNNPADDIIIQGCNVQSEQVGLTTVFTLDLYSYVTTVAPNGGILGITSQTLNGCVQSQQISFSIGAAYSQIKGLAAPSNTTSALTEGLFWASVVKKALNSLDASCLGLNSTQLAALSFSGLIQKIIDNACEGGNCDAVISTNIESNSGADVTISWTNVSDVYEVSAYMDGNFKSSVVGLNSIKFTGAADGNLHNYTLVSKCANGIFGQTLTGSFKYYGCPAIAAPTVTSNNIASASCPYNLTALVNALPTGITAEWHNANNTTNTSIVLNPALASDGIYYVFAKNSDGCYSSGVQVILTCSDTTNCSVPQNVIVEAITGGNRVRFQSAAYPPPANSYTVKRRLASDADVSGSYTTLGAAVWDVSSSRWQIFDNTAIANTLYVYRVISNCTSSAPYTDYQFGNITCPSMTFTADNSNVNYSFTNVGGQVDKYEVTIYQADGVTAIHTDTIIPSFPSPIIGSFTYLDQNTTYKVRVRTYIGSYFKDCTLFTVQTTFAGEFQLTVENQEPGCIVTGVSLDGTPILTEGVPINNGGASNGFFAPTTGALAVTLSGTPTSGAGCAAMYVNDAFIEGLNIAAGAGTYSFTSRAFADGDNVQIMLTETACP